MGQVERSGASVEEAIESALQELGISEQEAHVQVLQEPRSGFLGINGQPAIVRVSVTRAAQALDEDELDDQGDAAADFLEGLFEIMDLPASVDLGIEGGVYYVDVRGEEGSESMGVLIGKHGHTLDALQDLVRTNVQRALGSRCQVVVDVENYRKRRRSLLIRQARDVARRVKASGRPQALPPMSAFERKIVHDAVGEMSGLVTESEGMDPERRVVVRRAD